MGKVHITESGFDNRIEINGDASRVLIRDPPKGTNLLGPERIRLTATTGSVELKSEGGANTINLNGATADVVLGGANQDGNLLIRNAAGDNTINLNGGTADIALGGKGQDANVFIRNGSGNNTITLDGKAGDIILANADCAEEFDIVDPREVEPGTVVVLNEDGLLRASQDAYDTKVAGVISGAGACKPAIILDRRQSQTSRMPVALVGKVYCKVDAQHGPIEVGDLLTTSVTAGHAMKADDPRRAFGAVLGKALHPLREGRGLIPVLIALQ
jgi:hypothetical protein